MERKEFLEIDLMIHARKFSQIKSLCDDISRSCVEFLFSFFLCQKIMVEKPNNYQSCDGKCCQSVSHM